MSGSGRSAADEWNYATLLAAPKLPGGGLPLETSPIPSGRQRRTESAARVGPAGNGAASGGILVGRRGPRCRAAGRTFQPRRSALAHRPADARDANAASGGRAGVARLGGNRATDAQTFAAATRKRSTEARMALARRGFTKTHLALAERMFDPDVEQRKRTARTLPTLPGIDAGPWLLLLARDAHPEVRATALGLLATSPDPALAAKARQMAAQDPDPTVQGQTDPAKRKAGPSEIGCDEGPPSSRVAGHATVGESKAKKKKRITKARKHEGSNAAMGHDFEPLSGQIIEAAIHLHKELGPGFLESIYHNAFQVALRNRNLDFESQKEVRVLYESEEVGIHRLDLVVRNEILVELKAIKALEDIHFAQVRSYLKATRLRVGLLLNFNAPTLVVKRIVM